MTVNTDNILSLLYSKSFKVKVDMTELKCHTRNRSVRRNSWRDI